MRNLDPKNGNRHAYAPAAHCRLMSQTTPPNPSALAGLKVLEMGQLIAGPFAAKTLADFGAEVIKIETPGAGDPLRNWRMMLSLIHI